MITNIFAFLWMRCILVVCMDVVETTNSPSTTRLFFKNKVLRRLLMWERFVYAVGALSLINRNYKLRIVHRMFLMAHCLDNCPSRHLPWHTHSHIDSLRFQSVIWFIQDQPSAVNIENNHLLRHWKPHKTHTSTEKSMYKCYTVYLFI